MSWPKEAFLHLRQILTPKGRPQNGGNLLYTKSDNELYLMDADGTEHAVGGAGGGTVDMVVAGSQITVDATDPANPIVATAGLVESVTAGTNVTVDNTDPLNPIVSASGGTETLPASIIDAKGDLIAGTAADTAARIAVGSDGQALVADSASTAGVKWSGVVGNLWSNTSSLALSTLTGWTAGAGTWAISSGVIRQSSTTSSQKRLHFDTRVPLSRLVVECEVKMDTAASATLSRVGVVIGTPQPRMAPTGTGSTSPPADRLLRLPFCIQSVTPP